MVGGFCVRGLLIDRVPKQKPMILPGDSGIRGALRVEFDAYR